MFHFSSTIIFHRYLKLTLNLSFLRHLTTYFKYIPVLSNLDLQNIIQSKNLFQNFNNSIFNKRNSNNAVRIGWTEPKNFHFTLFTPWVNELGQHLYPNDIIIVPKICVKNWLGLDYLSNHIKIFLFWRI